MVNGLHILPPKCLPTAAKKSSIFHVQPTLVNMRRQGDTGSLCLAAENPQPPERWQDFILI